MSFCVNFLKHGFVCTVFVSDGVLEVDCSSFRVSEFLSMLMLMVFRRL